MKTVVVRSVSTDRVRCSRRDIILAPDPARLAELNEEGVRG